jgi:hypothetical protein
VFGKVVTTYTIQNDAPLNGAAEELMREPALERLKEKGKRMKGKPESLQVFCLKLNSLNLTLSCDLQHQLLSDKPAKNPTCHAIAFWRRRMGFSDQCPISG